MDVIIEVLLLILLLTVFFQDLKFRAIHIALPFAIAILGALLFFDKAYPVLILWYNFLFLTLTGFGLWIYLSLKSKKMVNPFKSVGIGDLLFFLAVIPYFSTVNYILYFITGMLFSIFSFLIIKASTKTDLVPLAGLLALYLVILKCISYIASLDFFETKFI